MSLSCLQVPFYSLFSFVRGKDKEPRCLRVKQKGSEKTGSPVPPTPPCAPQALPRAWPHPSLAHCFGPIPRPQASSLSLKRFSGNLFSL